METIGAHEAAADLLFDVEMTGEQFNLLTRWNRADQCAYSARRQAVEALFEYLFVADRFERIVDAAVTELLDLLDRIDFGGVYRVCRAETPRRIEFAVEHVDRDYLAPRRCAHPG